MAVNMVSQASSLERYAENGIVTGWQCPPQGCGKWLEPDFETLVARKSEKFVTAQTNKELPNKVAFELFADVVLRNRVYIQRRRKEGKPWKVIVRFLSQKEGRVMTENTISNHYKRITGVKGGSSKVI